MGEVKAELLLLMKCPSKDVLKLLHSIVDGICGRRRRENYVNFKDIWSLEEWWDVTNSCKGVLLRSVKNDWTKDEVTKEVDHLSVDRQNSFQECLRSRRDEIHDQLLKETCSMGCARLTDFDWQLKLVLGSDKIANVQDPLASVSFDVIEDGKEKQILLEMTKDELEVLINSLESANKAMKQLKT